MEKQTNEAFLVFGYGIPKNILEDEQYNRYLPTALNSIFEYTESPNPLVICCGGPTDMQQPSQRTEAEELVRWFTTISKEREHIGNTTNGWTFAIEPRSISSLENLIFAAQQIPESVATVTILCEHMRANRIGVVANEVFPDKQLRIIGIDFDLSPSRYISDEFKAEKDTLVLKHDLWALASAEHLKKHHNLYQEKLDWLRSQQTGKHEADVHEYWNTWYEKIKEQIHT